MQAATTCRARARAPVGLTAPRARTHRVKAFAAPRTRTVAARPVVIVRAADGASPRRSFTRRRPSSAMAKKAPPGHVGGAFASAPRSTRPRLR
mgnify:CR=1 FL=1